MRGTGFSAREETSMVCVRVAARYMMGRCFGWPQSRCLLETSGEQYELL